MERNTRGNETRVKNFMSSRSHQTRTRLIKAAMELFISQGVSNTTTKQIAELAQVNEVTLFRQFHNKHGLFLAVMEESDLFTHLAENLIAGLNQESSIEEVVEKYATECIQSLEKFPAVVLSVVGEANHYSRENRQALGNALTQANRYLSKYLEKILQQNRTLSHLSAEKLASMLNSMLLGYAVIELTSESHQLWEGRRDFLESLVALFAPDCAIHQSPQKIADLPENLVHSLLQRAKKRGKQEYAIVYLLFASGISAEQIVTLERSRYINNSQGQFIQISQPRRREVPINQIILGKSYGSYTSNPLTRWLKSRKDTATDLFINEEGNTLKKTELRQTWQEITAELVTPEGDSPTLEQAQQTWCVEMLTRGMTPEDLCLLLDWNLSTLQPYIQRAKGKATLEKAINLDRA